MAKHNICLFFLAFVFFLLKALLVCDATESDNESSKLHIVYMGSLPNEISYSPTSHHLSMLEQVYDGSNTENLLIQSYKRSFNGFAAMLNNQQKEKLLAMKRVVSIFPSQNFQVQTTRSWDFLGFPQSVKRDHTIESDLVVGVLDTGIWPESESFNDKGFGPIPKKWRGICAGGANFTCNKKIIGARFYANDSVSARDNKGHGTHTSSIASGREVKGVSFYGFAKGTARGGVPNSRVAVYNACSDNGSCEDKDILAAFDDAIADGVDMITISLGGPLIKDILQDVISIGSFHAMEKGILTVHAVGNDGPDRSSTGSISPWLFSVAATTTDRTFIDKVILGNGNTLIGKSINISPSNGTKFPIAKRNAQSCSDKNITPETCGCLDKKMVEGKIVLCGIARNDELLMYESGAFGSIQNVTESRNDFSYVTMTPSLNLDTKDYVLVQSYINSTESPIAEILKSEIFHDSDAPRVVSFSSRGPNIVIPEIMKPDISAPGAEILAAFSHQASISNNVGDKRRVKYIIFPGTSMACPHIAGIAAYVKSFHPNWSPAAIKSAIMTTAKSVNGTYNDSPGEFAYGSGNVNPQKVLDPGLIYDISKEDYVKMLCNYGLDSDQIKLISKENLTCTGTSHRSLVKDINYPALVIPVKPHKPFNVKIHRIVTNVGSPNSTYKATIIPIPNIKILVEPKLLSFKSLNEKQSFVVTVIGRQESNQTFFSSSLVWSDDTHNVKSPIIVQIIS